jgi:hypothetical protein
MPSSGFDNLIASPLQRQAPCRERTAPKTTINGRTSSPFGYSGRN